jgi:hypothetical protein
MWGTVNAERWENEIDKNALFVRKNHGDLAPNQMYVLVEFCDEELVVAMIPDGGLMARYQFFLESGMFRFSSEEDFLLMTV